jgi:hypothetical protein
MKNKNIKYFKDGDQWCCTGDDFIDLQESIAGFGETKVKAKEDFFKNLEIDKEKYDQIMKDKITAESH